MSYVAWSVVFGEQPTAAKWNILGDNDASFHDGTGIDDDAILARHIDEGVVLPYHLDSSLTSHTNWVWQTYTPAWVSSGTQPTLGNGTIYGRWLQVGKTVFLRINLKMGSTTSFGTGEYYFGLPTGANVPVVTAPTSGFYVGSCWALDSGTAFYSGASVLFSQSGTYRVRMHNSASSSGSWAQTVPFTWTQNDELAVSIIYELP